VRLGRCLDIKRTKAVLQGAQEALRGSSGPEREARRPVLPCTRCSPAPHTRHASVPIRPCSRTCHTSLALALCLSPRAQVEVKEGNILFVAEKSIMGVCE
jgi:hypothetical protein